MSSQTQAVISMMAQVESVTYQFEKDGQMVKRVMLLMREQDADRVKEFDEVEIDLPVTKQKGT